MSSEEWTYLMNVSDDIEADIVISLLKSHEIPARKHYPGGGVSSKVILGTVKNVDIYVDKTKYESAKNLVQNSVE
ncbi:putative signal transducing protein [Natranaerofaba carboxydovora]|uniref:putative signal transducing protein n=1 Tax=Natranaerofaba carboxydovora TaxID=2742683 RepID=UPI001F136CEC|nr:DUF2007 domain-containing protein [Natranaerofaba carboxydovora]UMZ74510.1 Putative prokaryotic signal transducing protein [Natranaerofaba carboxydovora]